MNSRNSQQNLTAQVVVRASGVVVAALVVWLSGSQLAAQTEDACADLTPPLLLSPQGGGMPDMAVDNVGRSHVV